MAMLWGMGPPAFRRTGFRQFRRAPQSRGLERHLPAKKPRGLVGDAAGVAGREKEPVLPGADLVRVAGEIVRKTLRDEICLAEHPDIGAKRVLEDLFEQRVMGAAQHGGVGVW